MSSDRAQLIALIERGFIAPTDVDAALKATQVLPSGSSLRRFVDRLLTWLGSLAIALSVVFFFAYNWADLGRFAKFALAQGFMIGAIVVYLRWQTHHFFAPIALLVASIGLGALLALYGQTYQTGADPWQLFFFWSILMLPWTIISRSSVLWIVVVLLMNVAICLYYAASLGRLFWVSSIDNVMWALFTFNTVVLIIWEWTNLNNATTHTRWSQRLVAVFSGFPLASMLGYIIFGNTSSSSALWFLAGVIWLTTLYWFYRKVLPDLFMLALGCLCLIWVVCGFLTKLLLVNNFDVGSLFVIALVYVIAGAAASTWLRSVHREMEA